MSTKSAGLAKKMGYKNIRVMLQGAPGWKKSGRHLVVDNKQVEKGNIVLVDLRPESQVKKGHIPRAVNIPFAELSDSEDEFPANMSAPLVFYGNGDDAEKADKMARKWGYKKTALIDGGMQKWLTDGNKIVKGAAGDEINWVRKLGKNEVSVADFKKAIGGRSANQVILDVRNNDEINGGSFAGAIQIPLDEIEKRIAELPQSKEVLIHCTTGARAEMACDAVKKAGIKSRFVVANVDCKNGNCDIKE